MGVCNNEDKLVLQTNGEHINFDKVREISNFPVKMYYNPDSIATVIAFKDMLEIKNIILTFHNRNQYAFTVIHDNETYKFVQCARGLYYYNLAAHNNYKNKTNLDHYSILQTVKKNEILYSKRDIEGAQKVTDIQRYLFWPGSQQLEDIIEKGMITNCKQNKQHVKIRDKIYSEPLPLLKE